MLVSARDMRRLIFGLLATFVVGCGGQVDATSSSSDSSTEDSTGCRFGELGRMPGAPFGVASSPNATFVVAAPFVNGGAGNSEGTLFSITKNGATSIDQNINPNIVALGDRIAYVKLVLAADGSYLDGTTLFTIDGSSQIPAQIDALQAGYVDISTIASDEKNALAWYRWPTLPTNGQPRALPTIATTSTLGQSIAMGSIDPDVLGIGAMVTDGTHEYARFDTKEDGSVIGVLPLNADPKVVIVPETAAPMEPIAVDDTMLLFSTAGWTSGVIEYWEVPVTGGTALLAADVPLSQPAPLLHDHTIYYVDSTSAPTNTIWALSETPNSIAKMVTTSSAILAMTADSCGIVYTTMDDSLQNGIVTRVPY